MKWFGRKQKSDQQDQGQAEADVSASSQRAKVDDKATWFLRLTSGLGKTSKALVTGIEGALGVRPNIDDEVIEALETELLMADVGVATTQTIIDRLTDAHPRKSEVNVEAVMATLKRLLVATLAETESELEQPADGPLVILVVGVNGAGKTTTIGKLAHRYLSEGKSVMLAAGDTFRAAAVEQLQTWGERNNVPVIAQHTGADSASVLFDALAAARARNVDVLLADTAGRLNNKAHLMEELEKIVRVIKKADANAPHETLLVLDAGTGQNGVAQAREFDAAVGITGIALTKLDGTAKGGV
ncbi:MAG: signal recognition particle-docking protein FtsY, partial [Pseudomonadota bacterium]|nr:signal recognition particle-docking protein FtsY [Pseudomonadota bacterium]